MKNYQVDKATSYVPNSHLQ